MPKLPYTQQPVADVAAIVDWSAERMQLLFLKGDHPPQQPMQTRPRPSGFGFGGLATTSATLAAFGNSTAPSTTTATTTTAATTGFSFGSATTGSATSARFGMSTAPSTTFTALLPLHSQQSLSSSEMQRQVNVLAAYQQVTQHQHSEATPFMTSNYVHPQMQHYHQYQQQQHPHAYMAHASGGVLTDEQSRRTEVPETMQSYVRSLTATWNNFTPETKVKLKHDYEAARLIAPSHMKSQMPPLPATGEFTPEQMIGLMNWNNRTALDKIRQDTSSLSYGRPQLQGMVMSHPSYLQQLQSQQQQSSHPHHPHGYISSHVSPPSPSSSYSVVLTSKPFGLSSPEAHLNLDPIMAMWNNFTPETKTQFVREYEVAQPRPVSSNHDLRSSQQMPSLSAKLVNDELTAQEISRIISHRTNRELEQERLERGQYSRGMSTITPAARALAASLSSFSSLDLAHIMKQGRYLTQQYLKRRAVQASFDDKRFRPTYWAKEMPTVGLQRWMEGAEVRLSHDGLRVLFRFHRPSTAVTSTASGTAPSTTSSGASAIAASSSTGASSALSVVLDADSIDIAVECEHVEGRARRCTRYSDDEHGDDDDGGRPCSHRYAIRIRPAGGFDRPPCANPEEEADREREDKQQRESELAFQASYIEDDERVLNFHPHLLPSILRHFDALPPPDEAIPSAVGVIP